MSGKKSKRLGYLWEYAIVKWLKSLGWTDAVRNGTVYGQRDRGDIGGIPWVWQAKNVSELGPKKLASFMDDAKEQARNAGARYFGVALKRRNSSTEDGFFVMPLWMAEELMRLESGKDQHGSQVVAGSSPKSAEHH